MMAWRENIITRRLVEFPSSSVALKLENNIESVDDTRDVTQNREQDVDEQIGAAATLEEDSQRREEDGKNDLEDVASGERHDCSW